MWTLLPTSTERGRRVLVTLSVLLGALAVAAPAAAEPTAQERALAGALFEEGRVLMGKGSYAEACDKLAESQRLDPGGGTLLNLALCHERQGRIATAWVEFREARALARRDKRADREGAAATEMSKIEPALSMLAIEVPAEARAAGFVVKLDGAAIAEAAWGTKIPVDPGQRVVTAEAPERRTFTTTVEIGASASAPVVTIPPLALEGGPKPPHSTPPSSVSSPDAPPASGASSPPPGSGLRTAGFVVGGLGLAGLAVGAGFGVAAVMKQSRSNAICPGTTCSREFEDAIPLNHEARTFARVADVAIGVGAAGVVAGVVLLWVAPRKASGVTVGGAVDGRSGVVVVRGAF